ncbi:hypothetical protein H8B09_21525 [Paenibacillus sp. PR3]|uniref:Uncharacterized protein n=1 Tax=Paenibacillus terricola TaxID=2763503 RepID=A0ABR8N4I3_9BACL|nr:PQQ-binding-like beta-propeller repeat protein [Paenibacillus terricola]MBD3921364.1 hypothetical protein [Paenibacillus terricola]
MRKLMVWGFIVLCAGLLMTTSSALAGGSLTQIPPSQFTTVKLGNESHGQFRGVGSYQFTSLSQANTPKDMYYSPTTKWTYALDNFNVFKHVKEQVLAAFDTKGKQMWKVSVPGDGYRQLIIGPDNILYVYVLPSINLQAKEPNLLYAFDLKGQLKWKYVFEEPQQMFVPVWALGPQSSFYTVTNNSIVCIQNGKLVWEMQVPTYTNSLNLLQTKTWDILVDGNGSLFMQDEEGWVEKRDAKQQLVWRAQLGSDILGLVGDDRYLISYQHMKHQYYDAATGKPVASPNLDYAALDRSMLPNDRKGGFYAPEKIDKNGVASGNGIVKFNEKGQVIWHYKIRFSGYSSIRELMSDAQGNAYFLDNGGHLYSVDPNGNERFIVLSKDEKETRGTYLPLYVSPEGVAVSSNGDVGMYRIAAIMRK